MKQYSFHIFAVLIILHIACCNSETEFISNLADSSLSGSSQWSDFHGYHRSRLNTVAENGFFGAWSAGTNDANQYIEADLGVARQIIRVAIQGRQDFDQWVTTYRFGYSLNGTFEFILDAGGNPLIFAGNSDRDTIVETVFDAPIIARYVRIYPQMWFNHISLRWGVYGNALAAQNDNPFYPTDCVVGDQDACDADYRHSVCEETTITDNGTTTTVSRCRCPEGYVTYDTTDLSMPAGNCIALNAFFATSCSNDAYCITAGHLDAVCNVRNIEAHAADPTLTNTLMFCTCRDGWQFSDVTDPDNPSGICLALNGFFSTECMREEDCWTAGHRDAVCEVRNHEADTINGTVIPNTKMFCTCRDDWEFSNMTDPDNPSGVCQLHAGLYDECDESLDPPQSLCVVDNSICEDDGSNQGKKRCKCDDGYISYTTNTSERICAKIVKAQQYPVCDDCETNEGTCFSKITNMTLFDEDPDTYYECKCPITQVRSEDGVDCGKNLANVTCDVGAFAMTVCYEPHPGLSPDFLLYADGKGTVEVCKGTKIDPDINEENHGCPVGSERKLVLDLRTDKLAQCGVAQYPMVKKTKFQKTIVVKNDSSSSSQGDYHFDVHCTMTTEHESSFNAFGVRGVAGNDQGEHLEPTIYFRIFTELGKELAEGSTMRLGDRMRLRIDLKADGTYAALSVMHCTASTSPKMPDEKAETAPLLIDYCPAEGQTIFTADNIWRRVSNQPNVLETDLIPAFKLSSGFEVFLHCAVKLCLVTNEDDCRVMQCSGANTNSAGRRKRRETTTEKDVVSGFTIEQEAEESSNKIIMETAGFALMISILLIILVVLGVLVVLLYIKLRGRGAYVEDIGSPPNKPQRFALPRVGNAAMRM